MILGSEFSEKLTHAKLANAYGMTRDGEAARHHLVAGRAIMAGLVGKFPDWAQWRDDLAWFDRLLGQL